MPASRATPPHLLSFDVFGTLVDVRQGSRDAFAAIMARSGGRHVDPLQFWEHWEHGNMRRYWEPYRPYRSVVAWYCWRAAQLYAGAARTPVTS